MVEVSETVELVVIEEDVMLESLELLVIEDEVKLSPDWVDEVLESSETVELGALDEVMLETLELLVAEDEVLKVESADDDVVSNTEDVLDSEVTTDVLVELVTVVDSVEIEDSELLLEVV